MFDINKIRNDFPILGQVKDSRKLIYLDSAATSQKPQQVIDAISAYYCQNNSNIHRGLYDISEKSTEMYNESRRRVAKFINADFEEIVFTRNATESINLVAYTWARENIKEGQNIVLSILEHHSNIVPWQVLAKEKKVELRFVDIEDNGVLKMKDYDKYIDKNTALVGITHISNSLGTVNPIEKIIKKAHKRGVIVLVDACQSVPHKFVDVKALDVDFLVFSGHKMLGPSGIGVLYGKKTLLEKMKPFLTGGGMIQDVNKENTEFEGLPSKFEAGTPNIEGALGLKSAIDYLDRVGLSSVKKYEEELLKFTIDEFGKLGFITMYGPIDTKVHAGILSFNIKNIHPHDVSHILNDFHICVRAGQHCTNPLLSRLGVVATLRMSFYLYNTKEEISKLVDALKYIHNIFM